MIETVSRFEGYAEAARPRIDASLAAYMDLPNAGCPASLREAMLYSLLTPGKRLRPILVLLAAEACHGTAESALPAACAVEMVHAYSLVHDDLPAMDDDDLRRGRPTCHKVYGEAMAILAGDALLALAFQVLAADVHPPATAAACCAVLAEAAGAGALVGGQADDLAAAADHHNNGRPDKPTSKATMLARLESIHERKTGALLAASLRLGALTALASREQHDALAAYGIHLGLAFQIVDDLLDVRGTEATLGKRVGKDSGRGKLTFPGLMGIEESERRAERLVDDACRAIAPLGEAAAPLESLARYILERQR